jgi:ABC-type transporter Mla subunit MlaD
MQEASSELRDTLENIHMRKQSIDAVETMERNIEGFNNNAYNLQKSMERFDGTVNHTFVKIDEELGQAVEKLASFAHALSEQNDQVLEAMAALKQQEK